MRDALRKAELELDREMKKQVDIIYSAAAIAFARYWNDGWGPLRIRRIFDETLEAWNECGETTEYPAQKRRKLFKLIIENNYDEILDDAEQYLTDNSKTFGQEFAELRR